VRSIGPLPASYQKRFDNQWHSHIVSKDDRKRSTQHLLPDFIQQWLLRTTYNSHIDARNVMFSLSRGQYNFHGDGESLSFTDSCLLATSLPALLALPQVLSRLKPAGMDATERDHCLEATRPQVFPVDHGLGR